MAHVLPVIFVTVAKAADTAIEAMKRGAFAYIYKPIDLIHLQATVLDASARPSSAGSDSGPMIFNCSTSEPGVPSTSAHPVLAMCHAPPEGRHDFTKEARLKI